MTKAPTKGQLRRDKVLLALRDKPDQTWQELEEVQLVQVAARKGRVCEGFGQA
jgi:hypothetical protein